MATTTQATPVVVAPEANVSAAVSAAVSAVKGEAPKAIGPMFETPAKGQNTLGKQVSTISLDLINALALAQDAILWGHDVVFYSDFIAVHKGGPAIPDAVPTSSINYPLKPKYLA